MKIAGRIVEAMHARILEKVEPGIRKNDLVAEIYDAALRGVDGFGGDYAAIVPLLPSGEEASAPHLTWDDKPMRSGEGTFFEIAGCYKRYHCPLSRTVFLGKPTQAFLDAEKAVLEGMEAGPCGRKARQCMRGHRQCVFRGAQALRHRQGQPHRLPDRPKLSAGLGRAHHEPAPRRQDGTPAGHDVPFHDRSVAREYGVGDHREHRHHRQGRRLPLQRAAPAVRESREQHAAHRAPLAHRSQRRLRRGRGAARISAPALQPGRLGVGLGDDSDHRGETRRGADGPAHRRQPWRRVRRSHRPVRPRPHSRQPNRFRDGSSSCRQ